MHKLFNVSLFIIFLSIVSTQITSAESSADAQVVTLEHQFENAMVIGDIAFLDSLLTEDFSFTHGDGWAKGGTPLRVDSKDTTLEAAASGIYGFRTTTGDIQVEVHGDAAISKGSYQAEITRNEVARIFDVSYVRLYLLLENQWRLASHLTVDGPYYHDQR